MESPEHPRSHRSESGPRSKERQAAPAGLPAIALGEEEAARFLKALERPGKRTVARLADLRSRA